MNITQVRIFRAAPSGDERLKAYVTLILDDCFVVRDVKIIQGSAGLFVAMPSKRKKDGTFQDIAHPLRQDVRAVFEKRILDAYDRERAESDRVAS